MAAIRWARIRLAAIRLADLGGGDGRGVGATHHREASPDLHRMSRADGGRTKPLEVRATIARLARTQDRRRKRGPS